MGINLKKKADGDQAVEEFDLDKALAAAEIGLDAADAATAVDRSKITKQAQDNAMEAALVTGVAIAADQEADEALRLVMIAERSGNREQIKRARANAKAARKQARADHNTAIKIGRKAYDAIRFSSPNRLGFLRFIQVLIIISILYTLFALSTYVKGNYVLSANEIIKMIIVTLSGVTFWLIWKRKKATRVWVIATSIFSIVALLIGSIAAGGEYVILDWLLNSITYVILLVYFLTSRRVKAMLVYPMNQRSLKDEIIDDRSFFQPKTWAFWRNILIYFAMFSIVGHWMEAAVCLLVKYGIVPGTYDPTSQIWSDWLYPFPVYGIGFVLCAILLYPLKNALQKRIHSTIVCLILSFIANLLVCTAIEFFMGLAVNADLQLWDYSDMFGNIMGQVCILYSSFFGLVATLMTWIVYPALEKLFRRIPVEGMTVIFVVFLVGYLILMALYYVNVVITDQGLQVMSASLPVIKTQVAAMVPGVPWLS